MRAWTGPAAIALVAVGAWLTAAWARAPGDSLAETAERVRAAKIREAALRSVDASVELLEERLSTSERQALDILAEPERHRRRDESERLLLEQERTRLRDAFREQLGAFARDREEELSEQWIDEVMARESQRVDATVERLLEAQFPGRYAQARERAVGMQRAQLDEDIRPDAGEIEALGGPPEAFAAVRSDEIGQRLDTPDGEALVAAYVVDVASGHALFEENETVLQVRVRAAIRDGLILLWRQLRLVDRAEPDGMREHTAITKTIQADLVRLATEAERVSGTRYGVFPAAAAFAVERARKLEIREFVTFLRAQLDPDAGCPPLPAERVRREIPASYSAVPAELAVHQQALEGTLLPEAKERVLDAYVGAIEDDDARARFRQALGGLLATEPEVGRVFDARGGACIRQPLQAEREVLARKELRERASAIADYSLEFSDAVLRRIEADPHAPVEALGVPAPADLHLKEARKAYQRHLDELRVEAEEVVWRQKALTRMPEQKGRFVEEITADAQRSEDRKAYWQAEYEKSVLDAWRQARADVLIRDDQGKVYHPEKYDRVIASVSEIIEEIITLEFVKGRAGRAAGDPASHAGAATAAPTVVSAPPSPTAENLPRGDSGFAEGPAIGAQTKSGGGGPVARVESERQGPGGQAQPVPGPAQAQGGGGSGAAEDCDALLAQCSAASRVCSEALTRCKNDPASCDAGVARCAQERRRCTAGSQPATGGPRNREASRTGSTRVADIWGWRGLGQMPPERDATAALCATP